MYPSRANILEEILQNGALKILLSPIRSKRLHQIENFLSDSSDAHVPDRAIPS